MVWTCLQSIRMEVTVGLDEYHNLVRAEVLVRVVVLVMVLHQLLSDVETISIRDIITEQHCLEETKPVVSSQTRSQLCTPLL